MKKACSLIFPRWLIGVVVGAVLMIGLLGMSGCSEEGGVDPGSGDTTVIPEPTFDINKLNDTYAELAPFENWQLWGPYNVHDPSVKKFGEYFYSYSTDAAFGLEPPVGIQIRRSKNLVDWRFRGWALKSLPTMGANFINSRGGTPFTSLWAPYIMKVGSEYRLYYSLSSARPRLSTIGLLISDSPEGPWTERGLAVTSLDDASIQTNAIDPSVIIDKDGKYWMYYGSAWDGIYILELDPTTGLAKTPGDKGTRIAQRGFTGGKINGNIEGPEIIYNEEFDKYYLFIAYDWLATKYNVRAGRADTPQGPFYDYNGEDLNESEDNIPMIIAPYKFIGHGGWQGVSHCAVFEEEGQFYIAHQGRPFVNFFYMVMHVRKLFWTKDGWPLASPERYAATEQTVIPESELVGSWERIELNYLVVPGYDQEQTSPNMQVAEVFELAEGGAIPGDASRTWMYRQPWIVFKTNDAITDSVYVERGRDWENKKDCLIFTGLDAEGTAIWGKK